MLGAHGTEKLLLPPVIRSWLKRLNVLVSSLHYKELGVKTQSLKSALSFLLSTLPFSKPNPALGTHPELTVASPPYPAPLCLNPGKLL